MNLINAYKKADDMGNKDNKKAVSYGILKFKGFKYDIACAELGDVLDDILYSAKTHGEAIEAIGSQNWEVIPKTKDVWFNVYRDMETGEVSTGVDTYSTEAKAKKGACTGRDYVGTYKITVKEAA